MIKFDPSVIAKHELALVAQPETLATYPGQHTFAQLTDAAELPGGAIGAGVYECETDEDVALFVELGDKVLWLVGKLDVPKLGT